MKRFLSTVMFLAFAGLSSVFADNDRMIRYEQLPAPAREFVRQYFPQEKISYVKEERDFLEVRYEILFAGMKKVEFYKDGKWKEVNCGPAEVPAALIPVKILEYVRTHHPGTLIQSIDTDRKEFEVGLSNTLELTFDRNFNLIDIDD